MLKCPGLIDPHVYLREPDASHLVYFGVSSSVEALA
jgi:dihydroorotase-like cyclic amidohydrolase